MTDSGAIMRSKESARIAGIEDANMSSDFDIVIRDGTIVDGSGKKSYKGDVAIREGRIAALGKVEGRSREEIKAHGLIVTPGLWTFHP
jgi:N-acyl-D-amino-acid deacylase